MISLDKNAKNTGSLKYYKIWIELHLPQNTWPQFVVVRNFVSVRQTGHIRSLEYVTGGASGSGGPSDELVGSLPSSLMKPNLSRTIWTCSCWDGCIVLGRPCVLYKILTKAINPNVDAKPISTSSPTPSTIVPWLWKRKLMKSNNNNIAILLHLICLNGIHSWNYALADSYAPLIICLYVSVSHDFLQIPVYMLFRYFLSDEIILFHFRFESLSWQWRLSPWTRSCWKL